jgi:hypothetical protein
LGGGEVPEGVITGHQDVLLKARDFQYLTTRHESSNATVVRRVHTQMRNQIFYLKNFFDGLEVAAAKRRLAVLGGD